MANTVTYVGDFETTLQNRLAHPQTWKEVFDVRIQNMRQETTSYVSTVPGVGTVTRGTAFNPTDFAMTAETLTISTGRDLGIFIDFADQAQTGYNTQMEMANEQADLLNEFIESSSMGQHTARTDVGDPGTGITSGNTTQITVSAANIDDIIRGIKRIIRVANGQTKMNSNGVFFVWRPADFELLEAFVQANGFMSADDALKKGTTEGLRYMGADHYWSNDLTANHLVAGVKKIRRVGVLRGTYGRVRVQDFPAGSSGGVLSGTMWYSRVDIGHLLPTNWATLEYDVNVA